jgi:hypothetical protein
MEDKKQWKQPLGTKPESESLNLLYETTSFITKM